MGSTEGERAEQSGPAAAPGSERLARARTAFLAEGRLAAGVVREPILLSWQRSRSWQVPADSLVVPFDADLDPDSVLARAADPVLRRVLDELGNEPVSVILCNASGTVLRRHTGDGRLEAHLDRVSLAPGFSYAEEHVGTNGIGTALAGHGPAQVLGHEHYVEHLEDLACAGVPVHSPVTGRVVGVLDLTCWRQDAGRTLGASAASIARRIEEVLAAQSGRRELTLLHDYLTACRRNRGAVIGVGHDLLMLNDRARELLGPDDQARLLAEATDSLASGGGQLVVDLPSGLSARVVCRPCGGAAGTDGVLQVQPVSERGPADHRTPAAPPPPLPAIVGSSGSWTRCCQAVDRHCAGREWLVLQGERGAGRTTLARAAHQRRNPTAHLRVLDAEDYGPGWLAEVDEEVRAGGGSALVLTHVDRLPSGGPQALADVLEPHRESTQPDRTWVVLTMSDDGPADDGLAALLSCFPRTVVVPPLRHHVEDLPELVPYLLSRLGRGRQLSCSPEAMSVLMRNRWPGNVEQLTSVLHKVTATLRSGVVEVRDLPPECRATRRWVLSPLEAIECDAIVDALTQADGNKAEAARALGMSRATIYRKIRGYGISSTTP